MKSVNAALIHQLIRLLKPLTRRFGMASTGIKINPIPVMLITVLAFIVQSCSHYYYVPSMQDVPLFREKGEYRLTAAVGGGDESNTFEVQGAYAAYKHVAFMSEFIWGYGGENNGVENWGQGAGLTAGLGYYTPIGGLGVFELYGGIGFCSQDHKYAGYDPGTSQNVNQGRADLSYSKIYLQPSLGIRMKHLEGALSANLSSISYNDLGFLATSYTPIDLVNSIPNREQATLFEPAITFRAGWPKVKAQFQFAHSIFLTNKDIHAESGHLTFGLTFMLTQKK